MAELTDAAHMRQLLEVGAGPAGQPPPGLVRHVRQRRRRRGCTAGAAVLGLVAAVGVATVAVSNRQADRVVVADPAPPSTSTAPNIEAFEDDRLQSPIALDGGQLQLAPYDGAAEYPRADAVTDFHSAEPYFYGRLLAGPLEEGFGLARVTVDKATGPAGPAARLADAPAWVALYRYGSGISHCPLLPLGLPSVAPLTPDQGWQAFVLPLDGSPALLWHGAENVCERARPARVEQARRHLSAAWTETSRSGASVTLSVDVPCGGRIDQTSGPAPSPGNREIEVLVSAPLSLTPPPPCPRPQVATSLVLPDPGAVLRQAPVGVIEP